MSIKIKGVHLTVIVLLAICSLFSGVFISQHIHFKKKIDVAQFHGTYLENPRTVNEFALKSTDQTIFDNKSLRGKWTMVFFGFTGCGYVCPTTLAELSKMYRTLEEQGVKKLPKVVMISIDPARDTLDKLGLFVTSFQPNFLGARGDEESVKLMTREMGVAYAKITNKGSPSPKDYDVQHSGAVMVFNPKGELNAFFTTPHHGELLAKDYMLLVS